MLNCIFLIESNPQEHLPMPKKRFKVAWFSYYFCCFLVFCERSCRRCMYSLDFSDDVWLLCDFGANYALKDACVYAVFRILNVRMSANYQRGIKINLFLMISKNAKILAWYLATQFPIILYSCVWLNSEWTYAKLR